MNKLSVGLKGSLLDESGSKTGGGLDVGATAMTLPKDFNVLLDRKIDKPDLDSLVQPPITTIAKIDADTVPSQRPTSFSLP